MKLIVFGASGRTGRCILHQAPATDDVTAFERTERVLAAHRLFVGDVLDGDAVEAAMAGQDAVLSALGPRPNGPADLCSRAMKRILDAMKTCGVRRIVVITGAMIGHPRDHLGLAYHLIERTERAKRAIQDGRLEEEELRGSGLEYTIVRPPRLTDGPFTGRYRLGESIEISSLASVSRADVADFMLRAVREPEWIGRAVGIIGPAANLTAIL